MLSADHKSESMVSMDRKSKQLLKLDRLAAFIDFKHPVSLTEASPMKSSKTGVRNSLDLSSK